MALKSTFYIWFDTNQYALQYQHLKRKLHTTDFSGQLVAIGLNLGMF